MLQEKVRTLQDMIEADPAFGRMWRKLQKKAARQKTPPAPEPVGPLPDAWPDETNVLIGGFALSGKSALLTLAARRLCASGRPPRILLLSPNGLGEHNGWDRSVFPEIVYDRVACVARLRALAERLRAGAPLSLPMWLMIDEAVDLFDCGQDRAVRRDLAYLLRHGPAMGLHMMLNSQYTRLLGRRIVRLFEEKTVLACNVWESRFLTGGSHAAALRKGTVLVVSKSGKTVYELPKSDVPKPVHF